MTSITLYLSSSIRGNLAELRHYYPAVPLSRFRTGTIRVDLRRALDLTDPERLAALEVPLERLTQRAVSRRWADPAYETTQQVGRLARNVGFEALVVPSAHVADAKCLVVFSDLLLPGSSIRCVELVDTELHAQALATTGPQSTP